MLPSISIIIPTYNVEAYIVECLQSVAAQTYAGAMECIVVDDCGQDRSIALAEEFINNYKGKIDFKVCRRDRNGGLSAARNSGTDVATGEYVFYLDSDDAITPDCIERMVGVALQYPEADFVQAATLNLATRQPSSDIRVLDFPDYSDDVRQIKKYILNDKLPVTSWNKLIRRSFLTENNISFVEGIIHEDVPFAFCLAQKAKAVAICRSNTYLYRSQREGSITTNVSTDKAFRSRMITYQFCIDRMDDVFPCLQIKSLFRRMRYAISKMPNTDEARTQYRQTRTKMIAAAPLFLKLPFAAYLYLPQTLRRSKVINAVISAIVG